MKFADSNAFGDFHPRTITCPTYKRAILAPKRFEDSPIRKPESVLFLRHRDRFFVVFMLVVIDSAIDNPSRTTDKEET